MSNFVYSVQMSRLSAYILFLSFFLLAACNEEKNEFMTTKQKSPVIDVNTEEYSLNGKVLGRTVADFSAKKDPWWLVERLNHEQLETIQWFDDGVGKLHVDENLSYGDFFKIMTTMGYRFAPTVHYTIGGNFKDVYNVKLPTGSSLCVCTSFIVHKLTRLRYKYGRHRSKLSLNEILSADNDQRKYEIDCVKDYKALDLMLTLYGSKDDKTFVLSLNEDALKENGSFHGFNFYSFNNEVDLWKFIAEIQSKEKTLHKSEQSKERKCAWDLVGNQMTLFLPKDVLMKDIAPLIKGLNAYGYNGDRITFSVAR